MKLATLIFLSLLSLTTFANEKISDDKGINVFEEIINRWSDYRSTTFDTTALSSTLISGRCYSKNIKSPWGSALVIEQRKVDNGPIGTPNDYISFGQMLITKPENSFDLWSYNTYKYYIQNGTIKEEMTEFSADSYHVALNEYSIRELNGMYYAVSYIDLAGQREYMNACYYYLNNN